MTTEQVLDEPAIIAAVCAEIRQLGQGDRAPSESSLIERFGISRTRARAIIQILEDNHLVTRRQGSGTFVNRPLDYAVTTSKPPSLHGVVGAAGGTARTFVLVNEFVPAPAPIAERLGQDPAREVLHLQRMAFVNERPAAFLDEYLCPGDGEHVGVALNVIESVEEVLRGYGYQPTRSWCRGTIDTPPAYAAERLEVNPAVQTWMLESIIRDTETGRVLGATTSWSRVDVLRVVFEIDHKSGEQKFHTLNH